MTNGDKIRSMTDEELTKFRFCNPWCDGKFPCKKVEVVDHDHCMTPCERCFYTWIKEEAKA